MALAIAEYQHIDYAATGINRSLPSITWSTDDKIVIIGGNEDRIHAQGTPTVSGLTFSAVAGTPLAAASNCWGGAWHATAASGGSGAIACGGGTLASTDNWGVSMWRITGANPTLGAIGALQSSGNNAAGRTVTISPAAGSLVVMGAYEWTPIAAGVTGTPTVSNEREDLTVASKYFVWAADWLNVAGGSTAFGITTGNVVFTKIAIELTLAAGGGFDVPLLKPPSNSPLYRM